ncbi:MAG: NADAR family protein [Crocinitomicaceae bacterium]|nr:NADAR family protein [Crocinitomicaceae bacterium]
MNYSRKQLIKDNKQSKFLFFWGHQLSTDGRVTASCFSQWWEESFTVEGVEYRSAEHWMMVGKAELFVDNETKEKILKANTPGEAKKLGRSVKKFEASKWDKSKYEIVVEGNRHKFEQNPSLMEFLINTGNRVLVEASPVDPIWGIGMAADNELANQPTRWKGENLLGFALMEVRDILKNENK